MMMMMTTPTMKLIPCSRKNCSRCESQSDRIVSTVPPNPEDQRSKTIIVEPAFFSLLKQIGHVLVLSFATNQEKI